MAAARKPSFLRCRSLARLIYHAPHIAFARRFALPLGASVWRVACPWRFVLATFRLTARARARRAPLRAIFDAARVRALGSVSSACARPPAVIFTLSAAKPKTKTLGRTRSGGLGVGFRFRAARRPRPPWVEARRLQLQALNPKPQKGACAAAQSIGSATLGGCWTPPHPSSPEFLRMLEVSV